MKNIQDRVAHAVEEMAWERRGENRHYYYKSVRHGDKVRKVYYGKGPAAEVAAQAAELKRAVRARRTEALRRLRASYEDAAEMVDRLNREMDCIAKAVLIAAGCKEHRGEFRRRASKEHKETPMEVTKMRTSSQSNRTERPPAVDPQSPTPNVKTEEA